MLNSGSNGVHNEMWKTYLLVHKFIKRLKRKATSTTVEVLNPAIMNHPNCPPHGIHSDHQHRSKTPRRPSRKKSLAFGLKPKITFTHNDQDGKQVDENHMEMGGGQMGGGRISPFIIATSFTRQLAFANLDEELNRRAKNSQARFYNSAWANYLAKISTVAVLSVTVLLVILKLTKIME